MPDNDPMKRATELLMETVDIGKRGGYPWKTINPDARIQVIGSEVYRLGKGDLLDTFYTQVFQHAGQVPATELIPCVEPLGVSRRFRARVCLAHDRSLAKKQRSDRRARQPEV